MWKRLSSRFLTSLVLILSVAASLHAAGSTSLVVSQVYGGGGNAGATIKNDFIEIYNLSASPVSVAGWSVQYASATGTAAWQVTNLTGTIQPGKYYLVQEAVGAGGTVNLPTPDAVGTIAMAAGAGKVALLNTTTALSGACPVSAAIIDLIGYGAANCSETATAPTLTNTTADIRINGGTTDTNTNSTDFTSGAPNPRNSSFTAALSISTSSPLPNAAAGVLYSQSFTASGSTGTTNWALASGSTLPFDFAISTAGVLSGTATSTAGSPFSFTIRVTDDVGTASKAFTLTVDGPFICSPTRTIAQIQGSGDASPFAGNAETTTGIVTGLRSNGFFLQMPSPGDGNPATSDGIFVFTSSAPPVAAAVGNSICVSGTVTEFIPSSDLNSPPQTELVTPSVNTLSTGNPLPAPIVLSTSDMDPSSAINNLEKYEGMRVQVNSLVVSGPTQGSLSEANATSTSNGTFYGVILGIARPFREPGIQLPDPLPSGSPANIPRFDSNPERLRINTTAQPGSVALDVAAGVTVNGIVGPLDFGFRTYTIDTDPSPVPLAGVNPSFTAAPAPLSTELTVASMNMQRFFDTANDPNTSDVVLTPAAFANRLNKMSLAIRNVAQSPDIIAVEEMENLTTLQALANKVNSDSGAPNPNYTAFLVEGNDPGGIDVGFLVKSSRVTPVEVLQVGLNTTYTDPGTGLPAILNDRPPLVLRATAQATPTSPVFPITVIAIHNRSLSGVDDPVDGNRVRTKRRAQAEFVANLIQTRQVADPTEKIVALGDYNAFSFNDGLVDSIGTIKGLPTPADQVLLASADLVNPNLTALTETLPAAERYSFNFDGNAQELDHVLVNGPALTSFTRFAIARNNSDFPEIFRNDPNRPERISDHDPAIAYFALPVGATEVTAQVTIAKSGLVYNRTTRTFNGTITITNTGAQAIGTPIQFVLTNLTAGVTLANASGTYQGSPYIASAGSLASGQSRTVPVQFNNPGNVAINTTVKIYSGAF